MSGKIYQGSRLVAQTNDAPLGFEDKGIELDNLAQYEQLEKDGNLQEDVNYLAQYISAGTFTVRKGIIQNGAQVYVNELSNVNGIDLINTTCFISPIRPLVFDYQVMY